MTEKFYERITKPYRDHPSLLKALKICNHGITCFTFTAYSILLLVLLVSRDIRFMRVFFTPAVSFFIVDFMRRIIPAKRPYEKLNIQPLIPKNKHLKSFPSRHVYSIYVIAMAFYSCCLPVGIILSVFGVMLAYIRVVGGVHFPVDTIAGALVGVLSGLIGFYWIP